MSNDFQTKLEQGKVRELFYMGMLGGTPATMDQQKAGIDFYLPDGTSVEVKADFASERYGNFYAELTTGKKPGCLFTSQADVIILQAGKPGYVYLFAPSDFVRYFSTKATQGCYKVVTCRNPNGYSSTGALIPVRKLTDFAKKVSIEMLHSTPLTRKNENSQASKAA